MSIHTKHSARDCDVCTAQQESDAIGAIPTAGHSQVNSTDRDKARGFIEWLDFCGYVDDEWIVEQAQLSQHSEPQRAKQEIREDMATRIATALTEARRETWEAAIDRINKRLGRYVMVRGPET